MTNFLRIIWHRHGFTKNLETEMGEYIHKTSTAGGLALEKDFHGTIAKAIDSEHLKIDEYFIEKDAEIPAAMARQFKRRQALTDASALERAKTIEAGKKAEEQLGIVDHSINDLEGQLKRIPIDETSDGIIKKAWVPITATTLIAAIDGGMLYNLFESMRFSLFDSLASTAGFLLAVDILVPAATYFLFKSWYNKSKQWMIAPALMLIAICVASLTFSVAAEKSTNARESLESQIITLESNGDPDGRLPELSKAHNELPSQRQTMAKGAIPLATTCISAILFLLLVQYRTYQNKSENLQIQMKRKEELKVAISLGKRAEMQNAFEEPFVYEHERERIKNEHQALCENAHEKLEKLDPELKEYFRTELKAYNQFKHDSAS